jgi:uncharacterized protein
MFPLGTVLFPGVGLPLRIFEPRYRELTRHCLETGEHFGIVLIAAGREVGGGDERFDVGTSAQIVHAEVEADGQANLVVVGGSRFRVEEWMADDPYPIAAITDLDDSEAPEADAVAAIVRRVRRMLAQRSELNLPAPPATIDLADDPTMALWQACALMPTASHDDLAMLATPNPVARLELLDRLLVGIETEMALRLGGGPY